MYYYQPFVSRIYTHIEIGFIFSIENIFSILIKNCNILGIIELQYKQWILCWGQLFHLMTFLPKLKMTKNNQYQGIIYVLLHISPGKEPNTSTFQKKSFSREKLKNCLLYNSFGKKNCNSTRYLALKYLTGQWCSIFKLNLTYYLFYSLFLNKIYIYIQIKGSLTFFKV